MRLRGMNPQPTRERLCCLSGNESAGFSFTKFCFLKTTNALRPSMPDCNNAHDSKVLKCRFTHMLISGVDCLYSMCNLEHCSVKLYTKIVYPCGILCQQKNPPNNNLAVFLLYFLPFSFDRTYLSCYYNPRSESKLKTGHKSQPTNTDD